MGTVRTDVDARVTVAVGPAIAAIGSNTTVKGAGIDLQATQGARIFGLAFVGTRTDGTYTFSLEQSDTDVDGEYAALAISSGSIAAISAATTVRKFSAVPTKRFVRMKVVSTSVTTGAVAGGILQVVPQGNL